MKKTITIGENDIGMVSNGATPIFYRQIFHKDLFGIVSSDSVTDEDKTHIFAEVAFVMVMQDQKTTAEMMKLTMDDYIEWSAAYDMMDLYSVAVPAAVELWAKNQETGVRPK